MDRSHNLLFVDDEEGILNSLRRLFRKEGYTIHTCIDPLKALEMLEGQPVDLIISDHNMSQMKGTEFLEKASAIQPDTIRILLTGFGDINIVMDAINNGKVYKFILKPWNDQDLRITVRQALKQYVLIAENRRLGKLTQEQNAVLKDLNASLEAKVQQRTEEIARKNEKLEDMNKRLEENFMNSIRVFAALMEMRNSYVGNHSRKVAEAAKFIAGKMCNGEEEARDVEIAALLHDIGKIGVPDRALRKENRRLSAEERELNRRHPLLGHAAVNSFQGLQRAALFIRHHHEKYNGTGYPDRLRGEDIPLGARIIAVPDRYDVLVNSEKHRGSSRPSEAVADLRRRAGSDFDPSVVQCFLEGLKSGQGGINNDREMEISVHELRADMVVVREVRTVSGLLLMPRGTRVPGSHIEKIEKFQQFDPVIDGVYIRRPKETTQTSNQP